MNDGTDWLNSLTDEIPDVGVVTLDSHGEATCNSVPALCGHIFQQDNGQTRCRMINNDRTTGDCPIYEMALCGKAMNK